MIILREVYGDDKVLETATPQRDVWGNFNHMMVGKLLVVLSELDGRATLGHDAAIKALLTDKKRVLNKKFAPQIETDSYHRFIATTNKTTDVDVNDRPRRNWRVRFDLLCAR